MTLNSFKIRTRLWFLISLAALGMVAIGVIAVQAIRADLMEGRILMLRTAVDSVHGMAERYQEDIAAGRLTREQAIEDFRKSVNKIRVYGKEYVFVFSMTGDGIVHPARPDLVGKNSWDTKDSNGVYILRGFAEQLRTADYAQLRYAYPPKKDAEPAPKFGVARAFKPWDAMINASVFVDDLEREFTDMLWRFGGIVLALIAVCVGAAMLIGRSIDRPIAALTAKMRALSDGDLTDPIAEADRGDEIGTMGKAVRVFKENAIARQRLEAQQEEAERQAEEEKRRAIRRTADSFESTVGALIRSVTEETTQMARAVRSMAEAATQTEDLANAVASATEETSANVQTVAASSEQLSTSIGEIGTQIDQARSTASEAVGLADRANGKVGGLAEAVEKIGAVVGLINSIAGQTNLLALNATIEAARAGEAGKGFAVVASEVKALATQTAKATDEIAAQVAGIQSATVEAVSEIQGVARVIERMNSISVMIASAVEEQDAATREIARNVQQAAVGTQAVAENIAGVTVAADRSGEAAKDLLDRASTLAQRADALNGEVGSFLSGIRAA